MKTLGIIGGLGPETTTKIYHSVIDAFRKNRKNYPSIVIYNLPFPFAVENEAIVKGINSHKMLPHLIRGAKILEKSGASFGILPCNTLHKYIEKIRQAVKIPLLSILDETALNLKKAKVKTVGILATETTVKDKLYDNVLKKHDIKILYPTKPEQNNINKIIMRLLKREKSENYTKIIRKICFSLQKRGAENILLACTDLQLLKFNSKIPVIDTTEILIQASMRELTKI